MKLTRILMSMLTLLLTGWLSVAGAQSIPTSAGVYYLVGRLYVDPTSGNAEVVGYIPYINGIGDSSTLFNGTPSERTAYFTFRTSLSISSLPSNGDVTPLLGTPGTYNIYYNPSPKNDWSNLDSFSGGQLIAQFKRPQVFVVQFDTFPFSEHTITETLIKTEDFIFKGQEFNFKDLAPGGVTLYNYISNTHLPAAAGYSVVEPYAGNAVAVASENQDEK